jgi:hypothetical protein
MKKIYCDKCDKELTTPIKPTYNMMPNGEDTDTMLCSKCFANYEKWLRTR